VLVTWCSADEELCNVVVIVCLQYMQTLEHQLQMSNVDNEQLRAENTSLKRKLALLMSEVHRRVDVLSIGSLLVRLQHVYSNTRCSLLQ